VKIVHKNVLFLHKILKHFCRGGTSPYSKIVDLPLCGTESMV